MKKTWWVPAVLACYVAATAAAAGEGALAGAFRVYMKWPFDAAEAKRRQRETAVSLDVKIERSIDLGGGVSLTLVLIPAGQFPMGSSQSPELVAELAARGPKGAARDYRDEHPRHRVTIARPFWLGKYELTQEQWQAVMGRNPANSKGPRNPVECVTWNECRQFVKKLNERVTGGGFSLPTEAQWEYACRAGTAGAFHFGPTLSTRQANYHGDYPYGDGPKGEFRATTTPVGSFPANAWGLHDLHGNVWEWCQDKHGPYAAGAQTDPTGPVAGFPILRGGSWRYVAEACRSANRAYAGAGGRGNVDHGLRLARPLR